VTRLVETADLMLDGNAIGGLLREVFAEEMTVAVITCAGCGAVREVGALLVYMNAPGTVVRCPGCGAVLMRVARGRGRLWLDLSGVRCIELPAGAA
jgi:ribosomal protein S27E